MSGTLDPKSSASANSATSAFSILTLDFYTGEVSRGGAFRLILIYENGKSVINNYFTKVVEANSIASANLSRYQPVFRTYATVSLGNVQGLEPAHRRH